MSANINPIQNSETGISVRNKLNNLITKAQDTSGSLNVLSGSVADFSASYVTESGSFAQRITDTSSSVEQLSGSFEIVSSSYVDFSASYVADSGSFSASIAEVSNSLAPVSASIALLSGSHLEVSASFVEVSASYLEASASFSSSVVELSSSIALLSSSYESFSSSYNSGSFTGSFTGSLEGSASYAATASLLNFDDNDFEVHVSGNNGEDEVGRGTLLYPYKTIAYALARIGNGSGRRLIIHRGQYTENITITATNMSIVGYEGGNGALTEIVGTVTVNVPAAASTRMSNIRVKDLVHTNTGGLFMQMGMVTNSAVLNGTYAEFAECRVEAAGGVTKTTAGTVFVQNSTFFPVIVNHANAVVYLKNLISTVQPTVLAGTLAIVDSLVYPSGAGPAITSSANTFVSLVNSQVTNTSGVAHHINIGGFFTYSNSVFNKATSTIPNVLPTVARFTDIDAKNLTMTGSLNIKGDVDVDGKITAKVFESQLISSSVIYESGSTKFGDSIDDTHQFTGSVLISGSLIVNSVQIASASIASGSIASASFASTASYIEFGNVEGLLDYTSSVSESIASLSSSFDIVSASFQVVSSSFEIVSSSYAESSASFSSSIAVLSSSFESVSSSYAEASSSFSASIASLSSSFIDFSASYNSGSFSGSFEGDGSKLTGLSAGFPYTGSAEISGSLTVTGSVSISGSLTLNGVSISNNGSNIAGEYIGSGSVSTGAISNIFVIKPDGKRSATLDYWVEQTSGDPGPSGPIRTGHMIAILNNVDVNFSEYTTTDLFPIENLNLELAMVIDQSFAFHNLVFRNVEQTIDDYLVTYRLRFL
jgi:hypothetical protein